MSAPDFKIKDVLAARPKDKRPAKLVVLTDDMRVDEALKTLTAASVLSAPLKSGDKFVGLIDMMDLLTFMVHQATKEIHSRVTPPSHHLMTDDMDMILRRSNDFSLSTLREATVVNASQRNPWVPVRADDPLSAALALFAKGVHRLPVVDDTDDCIDIVSQSDLVAHLAQYPELRLGDAAEKTAKDLGFIKKVDYVKASMAAIDAFKHLYDNGHTAVAIVDDAGTLVGNLSATDLKGINMYNFRSLLSPVHQWVQEVRRHAQHKPRNYAVWVIETTPFQTIVKKLSVNRVHRCFIVDDHQKPIGLVSLTDVLRKMLPSK